MRNLGVVLILVGIGLFVLKYFDVQIEFIDQLGDKRPYVAGGVAVLGAILFLLGKKKSGKK